jgi:hypothetical protein
MTETRDTSDADRPSTFQCDDLMHTERVMNDDLERAVRALAARRLGLVTRAELDRLGCNSNDLRRLRRRGLTALTSQVFTIDGVPESWERTVQAAVLSIGERVRGSVGTAAAVLRFEGFARDGDIHVVVPREQKVTPASIPAGVVVHTTTSLRPIDCATVAGIPITSASRTILDLARLGIDDKRLGLAIDHAVRDGLSSPAFLARRLAERHGPGHRGSATITRLLRDAGGHSVLEREFLGLVRRAGLPRPTCQQVFAADGRTIARSDFWFEFATAVVEVTGRLGHSTPAERQRDAQRRNELQDVGVKVFEYTYEDVMGRPECVVATVRARLGLT